MALAFSMTLHVLDDERPAWLARATIASRAVVEAIAHLLRAQWLTAMVAQDRRIEIVATFVVFEDQRWLAPRKPIIAPTQHRDQRPVEILSLSGQRIFVTFGLIMIFAPYEDPFRDEPVEAVGEDVRGDTKLVLKIVEAACAEERFTNDHKAPAVANHFQGLRDRTWTAAVEDGRIGRPPA